MIDLTRNTNQDGPSQKPPFSFKEYRARNWNLEAKSKPSEEKAQEALKALQESWPELADSVSGITFPKRFAGPKLRKLSVVVTGEGTPPWGAWDRLGVYEHRRRTFTKLRHQINTALAEYDHEVDHIEFLTPSGS